LGIFGTIINLAVDYEKGKDINQNLRKIAELYQIVFNLEHLDTMFHLALKYEN
jgi:TPR repeat protein